MRAWEDPKAVTLLALDRRIDIGDGVFCPLDDGGEIHASSVDKVEAIVGFALVLPEGIASVQPNPTR
jgi:hypothetical protein